MHAYIVIKDDTGRVIREYHGFQTDPQTGTLAVDNPASYLPGGGGFTLRAWQFPRESEMSRQQSRITEEEVFRGSRSQVERILADLDVAATEINRQQLDYEAINLFSEAQNSNAVYGTLMRVAGERARKMGAGSIEIPERLLRDDIVRDRQNRSSWAPGIHRDLLPTGFLSPVNSAPPLPQKGP